MRGWLVPGFCPTATISSACSEMSSRVTWPLPIPIVCDSAAPLDSWHMLEHSGRLLVSSLRASPAARALGGITARSARRATYCATLGCVFRALCRAISRVMSL